MDEKKKRKIEIEELEEDPYTEEGREVAVEADEMEDVEEGFMKGYEEGEKMAKCSLCHKPIYDKAVETEYNDETYLFCSELCADKFSRRWKKSGKE